MGRGVGKKRETKNFGYIRTIEYMLLNVHIIIAINIHNTSTAIDFLKEIPSKCVKSEFGISSKRNVLYFTPAFFPPPPQWFSNFCLGEQGCSGIVVFGSCILSANAIFCLVDFLQTLENRLQGFYMENHSDV